MVSGKTAPSFAPWQHTVDARAGGYVTDRFLTGLRPQEYYFHCMGGREGLVDTAVKTSRSGYLQRCLVKHLEELTVAYDHTVRDAASNVLQFRYGDDGLDVTQAHFLDSEKKTLNFLGENAGHLSGRMRLPEARAPPGAADADVPLSTGTKEEKARRMHGRVQRWKAVSASESDPRAGLVQGAAVAARRLRPGKIIWERGALAKGWHFGVVTKVHTGSSGTIKSVDLRYDDDGKVATKVPALTKWRFPTEQMDAGLGKPTMGCDASRVPMVLAAGHPLLPPHARLPPPVASNFNLPPHTPGLLSERMHEALIKVADTSGKPELRGVVEGKWERSLAAPGEAVGTLAAQSLGEPSTQMTLNTFHLAGSGTNVTMGIPRLREILMTASKELKTPTMMAPLVAKGSRPAATKLGRTLQRLTLGELLATDNAIGVRGEGNR